MRLDSITDIVAFRNIVRDGSFRAAAHESGLSCAGITKRLQRLEDQLGVRLLNRSTRKLSLTDEGRLFLDCCDKILAEVEEAESMLSYNCQDLRGVLRIALPDYFGRKNILPIINKLTTAHPNLKVVMDLSDQVVNIIDGGYDVAVRIGNMKDSNLISKVIGIEQRVIVGSPDYLEKFGTPTTPEDLLKHNALIYCNPHPLDQWKLTGINGEGFDIKVSGNVHSNNCESIREAVRAGMGISLRPYWDVSSDIQNGTLKILLPEYLPPAFNIQIVFPNKKNLSIKARAFIDLMTENFKINNPLDFDQSYMGLLLNPGQSLKTACNKEFSSHSSV